MFMYNLSLIQLVILLYNINASCLDTIYLVPSPFSIQLAQCLLKQYDPST